MPVSINTLTIIAIALVVVGTALLFASLGRETLGFRALIVELWFGFSWAKFLYSIILIGLVALLVKEVNLIWFGNQTTLGAFEYVDGASDKENQKGKELTLQILRQHSILRRYFANVKQSNFEVEQRLAPFTGSPIERASSVLQDLNITIQKIDITDILAKLRRWVTEPRNISGVMFKNSNEYSAFIELPDKEILLKNGDVLSGAFHFEGFTSESELAFEVACSLIWLDAAKVETEIANLGRKEFCNWSRHWTSYLSLSRQLERNGSLPEEAVKTVKAKLDTLTYAINNGVVYPKYWSLRADFVDLLPDEERRKLLTQKQNDELHYRTLIHVDAKDSRLKSGADLNEDVAFKLLAIARPALLVSGGKLNTIEDKGWQNVLQLDGSKEAIRKATLATGLFQINEPGAITSGFAQPAMGFAIGKNLIATAAYNITATKVGGANGNLLVELPDDFEANFVFGDKWPSGNNAVKKHRIKRILYLGEKDAGTAQIALLEIEGHDTDAFPPLVLNVSVQPAMEINNFVFLVGFPELDLRLPDTFMSALLGDEGGGLKVTGAKPRAFKPFPCIVV